MLHYQGQQAVNSLTEEYDEKFTHTIKMTIVRKAWLYRQTGDVAKALHLLLLENTIFAVIHYRTRLFPTVFMYIRVNTTRYMSNM